MAVYEVKKKDGSSFVVFLTNTSPEEWLAQHSDKDEFVSMANLSRAMRGFDLQNDFSDMVEKRHSWNDFVKGSTYEIVD